MISPSSHAYKSVGFNKAKNASTWFFDFFDSLTCNYEKIWSSKNIDFDKEPGIRKIWVNLSSGFSGSSGKWVRLYSYEIFNSDIKWLLSKLRWKRRNCNTSNRVTDIQKKPCDTNILKEHVRIPNLTWDSKKRQPACLSATRFSHVLSICWHKRH